MDLQEMAPIEGVHIIQGDITTKETVNKMLEKFKGNHAELVICDGAPDGIHGSDRMDSYGIPRDRPIHAVAAHPRGIRSNSIYRDRQSTSRVK